MIDNLHKVIEKNANRIAVLKTNAKKKDEAIIGLCSQVSAAKKNVEGIVEKK